MPGPVLWGTATCSPAQGAPEGWSWNYGGGTGLQWLDPQAVLSKLTARLSTGSSTKAILLHLHGAGCLSADMFCRAANLAKIYGGSDLEIVPVLMSWPTGGYNPRDYVDARRWILKDVRELADAFRVLAKAIALRKPSVRAYLTAHSLGTHLLSQILADSAARGAEPPTPDPVFDDALLFASDVDNNALDDGSAPAGSGLHRLDRWAKEIHVYFSPSDAVVGLSTLGQVALPIPGRAGTALGTSGPSPFLTQTPRGVLVEAINCGFLPAANVGDTQHHYWRLDPLAVKDVRAVLRQIAPSRMPWRDRNLFTPSWNIFPSNLPG
ncbi:MAG TPA: alpha/beta hydrolase [Acetobacteraceae bacterium]|nr:alpha/beta hydrolase [Acetobacteraceae bacterium]